MPPTAVAMAPVAVCAVDLVAMVALVLPAAGLAVVAVAMAAEGSAPAVVVVATAVVGLVDGPRGGAGVQPGAAAEVSHPATTFSDHHYLLIPTHQVRVGKYSHYMHRVIESPLYWSNQLTNDRTVS